MNLPYSFKRVLLAIRTLFSSARKILPYLIGSNDLYKEVTEQYPDPISSRSEDDLPARTRGLLFNDIDRCTGCGDCVRVCPVQCIRLESEMGPQESKRWVSTYDIDYGKCILCGFCVDVCLPASLTHTKQFEGAVIDQGDLVSSFGRGAVSPGLRETWAKLRENKELF